jgi:hypothetical protein
MTVELTPEMLRFWYRKIARKLLIPDRRIIEHPTRIGDEPWLWTGYVEDGVKREREKHRFTNHRRPPRPIARMTAPSWYPTTKGKFVPVQHVVWFLFRGPIPDGRKLIFTGEASLTELDVNPTHYTVSRGYEYEGPTWEEVGAISDIEGLIAELEAGLDPALALVAYSAEEIAAAQAVILTRN